MPTSAGQSPSQRQSQTWSLTGTISKLRLFASGLWWKTNLIIARIDAQPFNSASTQSVHNDIISMETISLKPIVCNILRYQTKINGGFFARRSCQNSCNRTWEAGEDMAPSERVDLIKKEKNNSSVDFHVGLWYILPAQGLFFFSAIDWPCIRVGIPCPLSLITQALSVMLASPLTPGRSRSGKAEYIICAATGLGETDKPTKATPLDCPESCGLGGRKGRGWRRT